MAYFKKRRHRKDNYVSQTSEHTEPEDLTDLQGTGSEAAYMSSLINSRVTVIVVLNTGAKLRGQVRYFDRDCFSLGVAGQGPNVFLRKSSVAYIYEE
jgi:sRNA-binding regulator protein Hfq